MSSGITGLTLTDAQLGEDGILRGLDLGGEPQWMAAAREAEERRQQEARELTEDEPG